MTALIHDISRRRIITQSLITLSGIALLSCSGGSYSSQPVPVVRPLGTPNQGGIGFLVFRNESKIAVYNFASLVNIEFSPEKNIPSEIGVSVSRSGLIAVAGKGENPDGDFIISLFNSDGNLKNRIQIKRANSSLVSSIVFSPDEKYFAFTVKEIVFANSRKRRNRTLVLELASNQVITQFDNYEDPVWIGLTGELVLRRSNSGFLNGFSSKFADQGQFANIEVKPSSGSYDVSPDGQFVVWDADKVIYAYDRATQLQWAAVEDRLNAIYAPLFAPNGRLLALHGKKATSYCPHIVPFVVGATVNLESDIHALTSNTLQATQGRMGWYV